MQLAPPIGLIAKDHPAAVDRQVADTVLEPLRGHRRYIAIMALRSLFRFAKRRGLTFADPTRHLSGGRGAGRTVLPMTAEQIRGCRAGGHDSRPASMMSRKSGIFVAKSSM